MFTLSKPLLLHGNTHSRAKPSSLAPEMFTLRKTLISGRGMCNIRQTFFLATECSFWGNPLVVKKTYIYLFLLPRKISFWGYPIFLDRNRPILRKQFLGPGNVHSGAAFYSGRRVLILRNPISDAGCECRGKLLFLSKTLTPAYEEIPWQRWCRFAWSGWNYQENVRLYIVFHELAASSQRVLLKVG